MMHTWEEIHAALLGAHAAEHRQVLADALAQLRSAIDGSQAGSFTLHSLQAEEYLPIEAKAGILERALHYFVPTQEAVWQVLPDARSLTSMADDRALNALCFACRDFEGHGPPVDREPPCGDFCHYIPLEKFFTAAPHKGEEAANHSTSGNSWIHELERGNVSVLHRFAGIVKPHVFSTLSSWVDELGLQGAELAEKVRDELGCPHFDDKQLVEIRFPETAIRSGKLTKPTFADAGGFPPFLPSTRKDRFGFARNLRSDDARGGPEVWHVGALGLANRARVLPKPHAPLPEFWRTFVYGPVPPQEQR